MPGGKRRGLLGRIWEAITNPESYAPPPIPRPPLAREKAPESPKQRRRLFGFGKRKPLRTEPLPPPRKQAQRPPLSRPGKQPFTRTRFIPNSELPAEWGRNQKALWSDATKSDNRIGLDPVAQAYYDAALYTFSESQAERAEMLEVFKQYIQQTYGIDWDDIFDWADYRANYDTIGTRG